MVDTLRIVPEELSEFLSVSNESPTGLIWIKKTSNYSRVTLGGVAGKVAKNSVDSSHGINEYSQVRVNGRKYMSHKIVYALSTGETLEPGTYIDHKDGDVTNNTIENLRKSDDLSNTKNARTRLDNKLGMKNVYFHKKSKKYCVEIQSNGVRQKWEGFLTPELANEFATQKRAELHGIFSVDNRSNT